ncbi:MAG: hypothetical protein DSZ32_04715 [Gammaproteobacteria bacterium]|nr:MAG: hypothetical protein DSZ32_04715 [Gammaproteobacteria bacterium]
MQFTRKALIWALLAVIIGFTWYTEALQTDSGKNAHQPTVSKISKKSVCGANLQLSISEKPGLVRFARNKGLRYPEAFANTVAHIRLRHRLPDCYVTKSQARSRGWTPGHSLWKVSPGSSIGGDRFGNRENRLPRTNNGHYIEADIDYDGRQRGAHRLVFAKTTGSAAPPVWLTTDHYRHFSRVPE